MADFGFRDWCCHFLLENVTDRLLLVSPITSDSLQRTLPYFLMRSISLPTYGWPPVLLVWIQLLCLCWINNIITSWSNPNQSTRRSAVQWYLPFQSKWVFSTTSLLPCDSNFYPSLSRLGSRGSLQIWQDKKFFVQYLVYPQLIQLQSFR